MIPGFIPSPPSSGFNLGPISIHYYALCIIAGILAAIWLGNRRWRARGGTSESLEGVLLWAIVAGVIGARLYHVITDYQLYFGPGQQWYRAFYIWEGGLGIWGAIALGAVVSYGVCRVRGLKFWALADSLAPGIILAQGIGRIGNWFNQELFGKPLEAWWALSVDQMHRPVGYEQFSTFHPTFLYELFWDVAVCFLLLFLDRVLRLGHGKVFWLYVALYSVGRLPIEHLKIDPVNKMAGLRLNEYTSVIVATVAVLILVWLSLKKKGRESFVEQSRAEDTIPSQPETVPATGVVSAVTDRRPELVVVEEEKADESLAVPSEVVAAEPADQQPVLTNTDISDETETSSGSTDAEIVEEPEVSFDLDQPGSEEPTETMPVGSPSDSDQETVDHNQVTEHTVETDLEAEQWAAVWGPVLAQEKADSAQQKPASEKSQQLGQTESAAEACVDQEQETGSQASQKPPTTLTAPVHSDTESAAETAIAPPPSATDEPIKSPGQQHENVANGTASIGQNVGKQEGGSVPSTPENTTQPQPENPDSATVTINHESTVDKGAAKDQSAPTAVVKPDPTGVDQQLAQTKTQQPTAESQPQAAVVKGQQSNRDLVQKKPTKEVEDGNK